MSSIPATRFRAALTALAVSTWLWINPGNAQNLDPIAPTQLTDPRVAALARTAVEFRGQGWRDFSRINGRFAGDAAIFPERMDDMGPDASHLLWSRFFRKTQIYFGVPLSDHPIIGYYNPLADYWLLTQWDGSLPNPRLKKVVSVDGAVLGGKKGAPGANQRWFESISEGMDPPAALRKTATAAAQEFESRFPRTLTPAAAPPLPPEEGDRILADRLSVLFTHTSFVADDPAAHAALRRTLDAVARGDGLDLQNQFQGSAAGAPIDVILNIPQQFRTGLELCFVQMTEQGFLAWSGRPETGRWYLVTGYVRVGEGNAESYKLSRILYVDLF